MYGIIDLLARYGPSLTSELAMRLRESGVSPDAARQRLSRLPPEVRVLRGMPFPKRARFIYLEGQFGTPAYWENLIKAISHASPAYAMALAGVKARGGIVPRGHFDVASGAPVLQKGQLASATILDRLGSASLLARGEVEGFGECVMLDGIYRGSMRERASIRARLITEEFLIGAIRGWLGRMNLSSPKATTVRDSTTAPQFATFRFDICGPSYLRPVRRFRDKKIDPGFFVADIVLGHILETDDVSPFIRKCEMLTYLRKIRPFMPMLIADGFTPEALRACRAEGIIATRPDSLFGRDVANALKDLLETLTRAGAIAATSPEKLQSLFDRLGSIEGAASNLRGALFELIVGHMVRSIEGGSIDIGDIARDTETGMEREIDVRHVKERSVTIYECKGYQSSTSVKLTDVDNWLTHKVPVIDRAHRQQPRFDGTPLRFEFWTCGVFAPDALALLQDASDRIRKYNISWKDGAAIQQYAKGLRASGIRKILSEHYFNHALSDLPTSTQGDVEAA